MFLFSDQDLGARLRREFITVSGNTHELQRRSSMASNWLMDVAEQNVERVGKGGTAQGFYVIGADGTFYGYNNNRSVERVNGLLDRAQQKFKENPPKPVAITSKDLLAPWRQPLPAGASVVRVFTRIRPLPADAGDTNKNLGRDHLWILKGEVEAILASAHVGQSVPLPKDLAMRMARFHLLDNVRGEPDMWKAAEVTKAEFTLRLLPSASPAKMFALDGKFEQTTADGKRGQKGTMRGEIGIDSTTKEIKRFRTYGESQFWGESTYTPGAPKGKFPLVFAMIEASALKYPIVPPQGLNLGPEYLEP